MCSNGRVPDSGLDHRSRLCIALLVIAFFALLGLWRFHEVLFTPGRALTNFSDGIGAIGGIHTFAEEVRREGASLLLGDQYRPILIGAGLQEPGPFGPLLKLLAWAMSFAVPADNAWDLYGLLGFIAMGLAGYLLAREVGARWWAALAAGLLIVHLDAFHLRLPYHLFGLGVYFLPLLAAWVAVRAGRQPTWVHLVLFAVLAVLNFLGNEYYGYFGVPFMIVLFAGYGVLNHQIWRQLGTAVVCRRLAGTVLLFGLLMVLAYPHQIGERLLNWATGPVPVALGDQPYVRTWPEFVHYATAHPLYIFRPASEWLASLLPDALFREPATKQETWEFSYRIGLLLPIFTVCLFLVVFGLRHVGIHHCDSSGPPKSFSLSDGALIPWTKPSSLGGGVLFGSILVWLLAALIVALFGISPEFRFSLVPLTYSVAPMFRVGARAFLYVDIAFIVLFTLALSTALTNMNQMLEGYQRGRVATGAVGLALVTMTLLDVSSLPLGQPLPARVLPDTKVYEVLKDRPAGLLLELPLFSPLVDPPEINYFYFYHRVAHGQPLVNFGPSNPLHMQRLHELAERLSKPDETVLRELKIAGVRYLAARRLQGYQFEYRNGLFSPLQGMTGAPPRVYDFSLLDHSPLLNRLASDGAVSLYEFTPNAALTQTSFAETFIFRGPAGLAIGGCGPELGNSIERWRWCGQTALIRLSNPAVTPRRVTVTMRLLAPVADPHLLQISGSDFKETLTLGIEQQQFLKEIVLPASGRYEMKLHYAGPDLLTTLTGHGRHSFRIFDLSVTGR